MNKYLVLFASLCTLQVSAMAAVRKESCERPVGESHVLQSDFRWNMSLPEIKEKEAQIRASGARLKGRAFIEDGKVVMPLSIFGREEALVELPQNFLKSVTRHVEKAFERGYIDALIFPDMGHSHLFIAKDFYDSELAGLGSENFDKLYAKVFSHPETKILYHTAEQLQMMGEDKLPLEDRKVQWRFYTRNLVGDLTGGENLDLLHEESSSANTARDYLPQKYRYWGSGFNISTSKDGCFSYKVGAETFYFDLSFEDLPYSP